MKILALVPARGGSKRLPGKNVRLLGGRPLIAWTLDAARGIPEICDVLVSTDDPAIAEIARKSGAFVPWLRPAELASDTASSMDVCLHALEWYERERGVVDGLLLLQPTSPFRSRHTVERGIDLFRADPSCAVIGVCHAHHHPMWCFRIENGGMRPFLDGRGEGLRSQDLPDVYAVSGSFYLAGPERLRETASFFGDRTAPLIVEDPVECIDIDTEWDWTMAEAALGREVANGS